MRISRGPDGGNPDGPSRDNDRPTVPATGGVAYAPHRRQAAAGRAPRALRRGQERATVLAYRAASWALGHLPERPVVAVAQLGFLAGYAAWPAKRRVIVANSSHVLGLPADHPRVGRLARDVYRAYAGYVVGLMRLPALPPEVPARLVDAGGEHGLDSFRRLYERLRGEGRAMIIVTLHVGSMETLAAAMASHGFPAYGVADDTAYPELYALLAAQRRRWGIQVIGWRNLREIHRVLREQGILALLVDWGYRPDGVPVRFFGQWTTLPGGPAVLAARTGAAIVPVVNRRAADGRYHAEHGDPIEVTGSSPAEIAQATQAVADALQRAIEAAPEQWYCFKPIWPESGAERAWLARRAAEAATATDPRPARRARQQPAAEAGAEDAGPEPAGAEPGRVPTEDPAHA
ncbi:MAG: lysophospholipid acyltransferase family protein [Candidatus Limnocylindrales bacterium]